MYMISDLWTADIESIVMKAYIYLTIRILAKKLFVRFNQEFIIYVMGFIK